MKGARTSNDLRCSCPRATKLAEFGVTHDGEPYLWIKIFKQSRIFGEVFSTAGDVHVRCRDCGRFTLVAIKRGIDVAHDATPTALTSL